MNVYGVVRWWELAEYWYLENLEHVCLNIEE